MSFAIKSKSLDLRAKAAVLHLPGIRLIQHIRYILTIFKDEREVRKWESKAQQQLWLKQVYFQKKSDLDRNTSDIADRQDKINLFWQDYISFGSFTRSH